MMPLLARKLYIFLIRINYFISNIFSKFGASLMIIMSILIFFQVVLRYVFSNPFPWAEELTIYMMVYMTFLCMPYLVLMNKNIAMTMFYDKFSNTRIGYAMDLVFTLLLSLVIYLWLPLAYKLFISSKTALASQMPISRNVLYSNLPISFTLTGLICLQKISKSIVGIVNPKAVSTLDDLEQNYTEQDGSESIFEGE